MSLGQRENVTNNNIHAHIGKEALLGNRHQVSVPDGPADRPEAFQEALGDSDAFRFLEFFCRGWTCPSRFRTSLVVHLG